MIQFNMLPDVKLEYVRAHRIQHTIITASLISAGSAFLIFLLLFTAVNVVQKKSISDLNKDITKYNTELKNTPDLEKILTIQNQLGALPQLHADKPAVARTFKYIQQLTPPSLTLNEVNTDYANNTISISGRARSLDGVNTLTDTLKLSTYTTGGATEGKAFSNVVMSQFTRTAETTTFTVTANFEPSIFDNDKPAELVIPNTVSTPSVSRQPSTLFERSEPATAPATTNGTNR